MIITTTAVLSGKEVTDYLGLVSGEAILGANIFRDFFAGIHDVFGGRRVLRRLYARPRTSPCARWRRPNVWGRTRWSASI